MNIAKRMQECMDCVREWGVIVDLGVGYWGKPGDVAVKGSKYQFSTMTVGRLVEIQLLSVVAVTRDGRPMAAAEAAPPENNPNYYLR